MSLYVISSPTKELKRRTLAIGGGLPLQQIGVLLGRHVCWRERARAVEFNSGYLDR